MAECSINVRWNDDTRTSLYLSYCDEDDSWFELFDIMITYEEVCKIINDNNISLTNDHTKLYLTKGKAVISCKGNNGGWFPYFIRNPEKFLEKLKTIV